MAPLLWCDGIFRMHHSAPGIIATNTHLQMVDVHPDHVLLVNTAAMTVLDGRRNIEEIILWKFQALTLNGSAPSTLIPAPAFEARVNQRTSHLLAVSCALTYG